MDVLINMVIHRWYGKRLFIAGKITDLECKVKLLLLLVTFKIRYCNLAYQRTKNNKVNCIFMVGNITIDCNFLLLPELSDDS